MDIERFTLLSNKVTAEEIIRGVCIVSVTGNAVTLRVVYVAPVDSPGNEREEAAALRREGVVGILVPRNRGFLVEAQLRDGGGVGRGLKAVHRLFNKEERISVLVADKAPVVIGNARAELIRPYGEPRIPEHTAPIHGILVGPEISVFVLEAFIGAVKHTEPEASLCCGGGLRDVHGDLDLCLAAVDRGGLGRGDNAVLLRGDYFRDGERSGVLHPFVILALEDDLFIRGKLCGIEPFVTPDPVFGHSVIAVHAAFARISVDLERVPPGLRSRKYRKLIGMQFLRAGRSDHVFRPCSDGHRRTGIQRRPGGDV